MSTDPTQILRELGQKMLDEIDMLLRRNSEERAKLLGATARLEELAVRDAVLLDERRRLIARGESLTNKEDDNDTRHGSIDSPASRARTP